MKPFWIFANARITNFTQRFWYVACKQCHKAINVHCGRVYDCVHCNKAKVTAEARCRFNVELRDEIGNMTTNCFGQISERLFPFTAEELKNHTDEDGITKTDFLDKSMTTSNYFFRIKPYNFETATGTHCGLTIMSIEEGIPQTSSSTSQ